MNKRYDVIGAGISAVDDLSYVAKYPLVNSKIPIMDSIRCGGGPVCTAMAAVGALQGHAAFVARLGTDDMSQYVKRELAQRGVDASFIIDDPDGAPYHCVIIIDQTGTRTVLYDPSRYKVVSPDDIPDALLQSSELILLDYLSEPAAIGLARKARQFGVATAGDLEGQSATALELAALIDYLIVPEDFAIWATGESNPRDACTSLAQTKRKATIVTSGAMGSHSFVPEGSDVLHIPAFSVDVFDTTGCGDVFHGAFVLATARGVQVSDAIVFASAAAALKANASQGQ